MIRSQSDFHDRAGPEFIRLAFTFPAMLLTYKKANDSHDADREEEGTDGGTHAC